MTCRAPIFGANPISTLLGKVVLALLPVLGSCSDAEVLTPLDDAGTGTADTDTETDTNPDPSCSEMPADACGSIGGVGEDCQGPGTIGRIFVAVSAGIHDHSLTGAANDDQACAGNGPDKFYKLYILEGETLTVSHTAQNSGDFEPIVAVFKTPDPCLGVECGNLVSCDENPDGTDNASISGYTSTSSSWHIIKVASKGPLEGSGDYSINLGLECLSPYDCDC